MTSYVAGVSRRPSTGAGGSYMYVPLAQRTAHPQTIQIIRKAILTTVDLCFINLGLLLSLGRKTLLR
jgi:hypothetical protein